MDEMPREGKPFARGRRWLRGLLTCFVFTTIGTVLLMLPWLPGWDQNYFSSSWPKWYSIWISPYFRGAVSGIGVVNILVSFLELTSLMRGGRH